MAVERLPCVVIGAGVVGLSVARAVAASMDTVVVEARSRRPERLALGRHLDHAVVGATIAVGGEDRATGRIGVGDGVELQRVRAVPSDTGAATKEQSAASEGASHESEVEESPVLCSRGREAHDQVVAELLHVHDQLRV